MSRSTRRGLREEVERHGLVIVEGSKHLKIMCPETNRLIGVAPRSRQEKVGDRNTKNLIAAMRRFARQKEVKSGKTSS